MKKRKSFLLRYATIALLLTLGPLSCMIGPTTIYDAIIDNVMQSRINTNKLSTELLNVYGQIQNQSSDRSYGPMMQRKDFFYDIVGIGAPGDDLKEPEYAFRNEFNWGEEGKPILESWQTKIRDIVLDHWIHQYPRRAAIFQGTLELKTIRTMNGELIHKKRRGKGGRFDILMYDPFDPTKTDIRATQANPKYKDAVFQLASTLCGPLEGGMTKPDELLTNMLFHAVQGEEGSISAAGATIWRKYFMPTLGLKECDPILKKNKNLLNPGDYCYALHFMKKRLPKNRTGEHCAIDPEFAKKYEYTKNDEHNVIIPIHKDIVVSSGYGKINYKKRAEGSQKRLTIFTNVNDKVDTEKSQIISQVFTSAYNLRDIPEPDENQIALAQMLLNAAYEGTVKAAYLADKKRVFLTLVGGGAFRNKIEWIGNALNRPKFKNFIKKTGLQVTLIFYPDPGKETRNAEDDYKFLSNNILSMMDEINETALASDLEIDRTIRLYLDAAYNTTNIPKQSQAAKSINMLIGPSKPLGY